MASIAQIIIEVDDKGAVNTLNKIKDAGKTAGDTGSVAFTRLTESTEKSRESAALLSETFGVRMPRALRNVLAESTLVGPALNAAFNISAAVAFAAVLVDVAKQIGDYTAKIKAGGQDMIALEEAVVKTSRTMQGPQTFTEMAAKVGATELKVAELRKELGLTGDFLPGLVAPVRRLGEQFNYSYLELQRLEKDLPGLQDQLDQLNDASRRTDPVEILKLQNQARLAGLQGIAKINQEERGTTEVLKAEIAARIVHEKVGQAEIVNVHAQAAAQRREFERSLTNQLRDLHSQAVNAELTGFRLLEAQEKEELDKRYEELKHSGLRGVQLVETFEQEKVEITARYAAVRLHAEHDAAAQGQQAILQAEAAGAAGRIAIELQYLAQIHQISQREEQQDIALDGERIAARKARDNRLLELERQRADEEIQIQTETAIAMLPPWQRSDAQIIASAEDRIRKIREMEAKDKEFRVQGEREVGLIIQKEWRDRVESMANQLESLYDEISSGGIKQFFIKQFKHMVAEMVASWILGMQQMRGASQQQMGSGGGILGAIFGSLGLGGIVGGGGGGGSQGGISGLPGVITNFGGGNFVSGDAGGGLGSGFLGSLGLSAGSGASSGMTLPSGAGPGGAAGGPIGALLGQIFSHGLGPVSGGGLALGGIGLLAATFRGGGILNALGGAAGGAMLGFAIGGPIGALIGGIAGFLSGIFGHSTKKARLAIEADIKQKSKVIEDSYNLFQTDYTSATTALEQLRQQGVDALKQAGVKDISRSRVGHVDQWVNKAEKEIDATQAERNQRNAMVFGPAQFRVGGYVGAAAGAIPSWFAGSAMHFAGGGAVPAILHSGEYVVRPEAVASFGRGRLDSINAGGSGGDTHLHVTINAIDAKSVKELLSQSAIQREFHRMFVRGVREGQW
jgi:hypothetical protein